MSPGYWNDGEKTARSFVVPPGRTEVYYRTGDRVRQPSGNGPMLYLGRLDNQIKILGHRVELGEVEAIVRKESGVDGVVAVGWPVVPGGAGGIEVFLQTDPFDTRKLSDQLAALLPTYMSPRRIHLLPQFPVNANGKFDRRAMIQKLEQTP
jgi:acyl-coenzyme A synthetase/AMP-(fatty) acid ligase